MKKARFFFRNGDNVVYDQPITYTLDSCILCFTIDGDDYKIDFLKEKFTRTTEEEEFTIDRQGANYVLLKEGLSVEIKVDEFIYEKTDDFCSIEYVIESDENVEKELKIYF